MPKRNKSSNKEKNEPNIVVVLVEGRSDQIALEFPLADLIMDKYPTYEVRFLLQQHIVDHTGDEIDDADIDEDGELVGENRYEYGGDVTSSSFVTPNNIAIKITNRFIMPVVKKEGIYPKKIARIIQIVDLDGVYIPDENVVPYADERQGRTKAYYDDESGRIEAADAEKILERNELKRNNLNHLSELKTIKIKTKDIPYDVYFFSSNLDHFINHDANIEDGKKALADNFLRKYGLDTERFKKYFLEDEGAIGSKGYKESWEFIKEGSNSVMRYTNIDRLILDLISPDESTDEN